MDARVLLTPRHIQNFSEAAYLEPHWGYADRAKPCTNDPGSCEYLDVVYHSHDLGMLYSGILTATLLGIFFILVLFRAFQKRSEIPIAVTSKGTESQQDAEAPQSVATRWAAAAKVAARRYLLPETVGRRLFGRVTRLQVVILAGLCGYLLIFSLVGIVYNKWVTPVKNMPGTYNTRTSLGPLANRVGTLAFALMPFSILLSSRESLLSLTGIPYHHFNFLHRWLGHIIFIQSSVHTIGWCIVEIRLYQPQPKVATEWIRQSYMVWGIVAMLLLLFLWALSLPFSMRFFGYEFFRKSHYVLAMLYFGACIGHWPQLEAFLIPGLAIWFVDRAVRMIRTAMLHYNYGPSGKLGFSAAQAQVTLFADADNGDVVRLDFDHPHQPWEVGQHFFLCFPESSIWQSHPFTPMSYPQKGDTMAHTYLFRAKKGETKKIADIAAGRIARKRGSTDKVTPVILTGPYGSSILENLRPESNVMCIAGGTGITFVVPVLMHLARRGLLHGSRRTVQLIWVIRRGADVEWCKPELDELRSHHSINIKIFVTRQTRAGVSEDGTREKGSVSPSSSASIQQLQHEDGSVSASSSVKETPTGSADLPLALEYTSGTHAHRHPDLAALVDEFVSATAAGGTSVFASGPGGMITDLRRAVARCNDPAQVARGVQRFDVSLVSDNRMEW